MAEADDDRGRKLPYEEVAWVRVEVHGITRQLVVPCCPFCRGVHRYGAGGPVEPLEPYLGVREQCCTPPRFEPRRYLLKPMPRGETRG